MCGCTNNNCQGCNPLEIPEGPAGVDGWTPQFAVVADGPTREVLQLTGWIGGTGTIPGNVGKYVGPTGWETLIANGENIRGSNGTNGASSFVFVDVTGSPDQSIAYTDGVTPEAITGATATPSAGTYNVTATIIYYPLGNTSTAKFGIYKGATLQNIALPVGPDTVSARHNVTLMASNIVLDGVTPITLKGIETTLATTMVAFCFIMTYQKIA